MELAMACTARFRKGYVGEKRRVVGDDQRELRVSGGGADIIF